MKKQNYFNYGDVNPIEHGGIWVKKIDNHTFEIIKNIPETNELLDLKVDITDSWIERERVMSFIGMTEKEFNPIWFAIGCINYYSADNFGGTIKCSNKNELIDILFYRGIIEDTGKTFFVSKCYQIFTPESIEHGDCEKQGFEYKDLEINIEDLISEIVNNCFSEISESNIDSYQNSSDKNYAWLSIITPLQDRDYFEKNKNILYTLHIKCTKEEFYQICKLAGLII